VKKPCLHSRWKRRRRNALSWEGIEKLEEDDSKAKTPSFMKLGRTAITVLFAALIGNLHLTPAAAAAKN